MASGVNRARSAIHRLFTKWKSGNESCCTKWHRQGRMPSKVQGVMRKAGWLMLLFSTALTAAAQQKNPMDNKACKQDPWRCGVVVTFDPPFDGAAGVLLVPNKVTVDVPLELQPTEVRVTTYPLGTGVADQPSEGLAETSRFQKTGNYARFRVVVEKCPREETAGGLEISVWRKTFKQYPLRPWGGAYECRQVGDKDDR